MFARPLRRPAPPGSTPAAIQRRSAQVSESLGGTANPAKDTTEAALKVPSLEAEILVLRQRLTQVQANRESLRQEMDVLRRDRDHWQNLAKSAEAERAATRAWFCGRASPRHSG
jgi:FtsZ-binding cell division protein ZapB